MSGGCSGAKPGPGGGVARVGGVWLLSFSATAGRVLRRGWGVLGRELRPSRRVLGQGAPTLEEDRGPQLSSSGTGAAAGPLLLSSASPAGRSRAGLGLECRCLRMKGKTLWAERGQHWWGPAQRHEGPAPALTASWSPGG